jgi:hypothetical protein
MPRIYDSYSDPWDYCRNCFPDEETAALKHDTGNDDGPDDRGNCYAYDADHPCYDDTDYTCDLCSSPLNQDDN